MASRCYVCKQQGESLDHIFVYCPYAQTIWKFITALFQCNFFDVESLLYVIRSALDKRFSPKIRNLWCVAIMASINVIWFVRKQAFNNDFLVPKLWAFIFISRDILEASGSKYGFMLMFLGGFRLGGELFIFCF